MQIIRKDKESAEEKRGLLTWNQGREPFFPGAEERKESQDSLHRKEKEEIHSRIKVGTRKEAEIEEEDQMTVCKNHGNL